MPKPVEAALPYLTPPAANMEDRTQPMGPLEEGDQALVDAAHRIAPGEHVIEHEGVRTRVVKHEELGRDQVIANTTTPDGPTEQVGTLIDSIPKISDGKVGAISADISLYPAGERGGTTVAEAHGNKVGSVLDPEHDREKAQAIKLEVAREIEEATQRLEQGRVADPALARAMADAESPHRDEIAERKKESALAEDMGEVAMSRLLPPDVPSPKLQAHMLRDVSERANRRDLEHAEAAAQAAREAHDSGSE